MTTIDPRMTHKKDKKPPPIVEKTWVETPGEPATLPKDDPTIPLLIEYDPIGTIDLTNNPVVRQELKEHPESSDSKEFKPDITNPEERRWPVVPNFRISWTVGEEYFKKFTKAHWQHFFAYLYRTDPIIIRPEKEANIDKFMGTLEEGRPKTFNLSYIMNAHGGGEYKIVVNDTDKKHQEVMHIKLFIDKSIYPPKLNYEELDYSNRSNRAYVDSLVRQNIITKDGQIVEKLINQQQSSVSEAIKETGSLVTTILKMKEAGSSDVAPMLSMLQKQFDMLMAMIQKDKATVPDSDLSKLKELMGVVKSVLPDPSLAHDKNGESSNMMLMMMKSMMETNAMLMKAMLDNRNTPATNAADPITQMDKMLDIFEKMSARFGGGDNDAPRVRQSTLETVMSHLPDILNPVANIMMSMKGPVAGTPGTPGFTPPTTNLTPPVLLPDVNNPSTPANMNQTQILQQQFGQIIKAKGQDIIQCVFTGKNGSDYAQSVVDMFGQQLFVAIAGLGRDGILTEFKKDTEFWKVLASKEKETIKFIDEFLKWPNEQEEEEGVISA